ncbi:hypothetical protein EIN_419750 [Entamoeba invadens IP1]|uniref:Expansin-like EG45 domain-containing protein n=1 Tax=Entamoeba invadens IP1 TaxID=370355 RepID=A0A0A1U200_ENTIV|nr:hypothetical protein EIN_419750 [Entamoeba invadens IP1]ELP88026.1 hypothetical protein EIN_419750 [Entamoeba invadens IP1]|eukprot:XP_004254797.1 hypothetical protein EIN_419750 [Entamoeba invadens IP1]
MNFLVFQLFLLVLLTLSGCPLSEKISNQTSEQTITEFFPVVSFAKQTSQKATLTPLSSCTKGRITFYPEWEKGGCCNYGPRTDPVISGYMFGGSPNWAFYDNSNKCGICYEMVGPLGTLRFRVDNSCPADEYNIPCDGSMIHFDLSANAFPYVASGGIANVTFRMVACDYNGNIKIKTFNGSSIWWFAVVVSEHTLGLKSVFLKDSMKQDYLPMNRSKYNVWSYHVTDNVKLEFPVFLKMYSINNDFVTATIQTPQENIMTVADGNFVIPKDQFFDVEKLYKTSKPENANECCTLWDDYSILYKDGFVGVYNDWSYKSKENVYSTDSPKEGKYCLEMIMESYGGLQIGASFPARADQYGALQFYIRSSFDSESTHFLSIKKNEWKYFKIPFSQLNLTDNKFWGFLAVNKNSSTNSYWFDDITLAKNENAPSAAMCWDEKEIVTISGN